MNDPTIDSNTPALDALTKGQPGQPTRRGFLIAAGGLAAAGLVAAACGGSDDNSSDTTTTAAAAAATTTTAGDTTPESTKPANSTGDPNDIAIISFAASLEVLAVNTYGAALSAAGDGKLGEVPPAVAEYVTTAQAHHQAHLDGWNRVLSDANETEVTDPPADLEKTVNDEFAKVTDAGGAAKLALMLEQIAAATYLDVVGKLKGEGLIKQAGSVQIIDMQHIAVLLFALGMYPVPDTFASPEMSAAPA